MTESGSPRSPWGEDDFDAPTRISESAESAGSAESTGPIPGHSPTSTPSSEHQAVPHHDTWGETSQSFPHDGYGSSGGATHTVGQGYSSAAPVNNSSQDAQTWHATQSSNGWAYDSRPVGDQSYGSQGQWVQSYGTPNDAGPTYSGPSHNNQPYGTQEPTYGPSVGQGQGYPSQEQLGQAYGSQPHAGQGYDSQPYGGQQYSGQQYGGQQFPVPVQQQWGSQYGSGPQQAGGPYGQPQYGGQPYGAYPMTPAIPGVTVDPVTGEPLSDKSKVAAGFLQFFLGCFGIGRFYIGDNTIGAIQLGLFFLGLLTSIILVGVFILLGLSVWALVDAIMMWTGSVRDGQGRKLR